MNLYEVSVGNEDNTQRYYYVWAEDIITAKRIYDKKYPDQKCRSVEYIVFVDNDLPDSIINPNDR